MTERVYLECPVGDAYLLVLDGRVVGLFHLRQGDQGGSWRWHVSTLGIDAGVRGSSIIMRIGDRKENGDLRAGSLMIKVPAEEMERLAAFIEAAIAARDA
jgi:hypothetical protein